MSAAKKSTQRTARKTTTPTKRVPKKTPAPRADASGATEAIRIRMYRVGFGDCFLLSFPTDTRTAYVLVDCGVHSRGDIATIGKVVADICEQCKGELALVVATHAHQDHISGFGRYAEQFRKLAVHEVWMPWTENPADPGAAALKRKQLKIAALVGGHLAARGLSAGEAGYAIENLTGNETALQLLKAGINGGKVSYLELGGACKDAGGIEGLDVQVLGPPRDQKFLSRMDPPTSDRFLRAGRGGAPAPVNAVAPFAGRWRTRAPRELGRLLADEDMKALDQLGEDPEGLAFMLDNALNNTSLVLRLSYKGRNLLFPGDAQYGNWQGWMDGQDAEQILESTHFYKVGHHGSHNATPRSAFDKMKEGGFAAMVSTQSTPWKSIPFGKLMKALGQKADGLVRSDSLKVKGASYVKADVPKGFAAGDFWFDYTLSV